MDKASEQEGNMIQIAKNTCSGWEMVLRCNMVNFMVSWHKEAYL